MSEHSTIEWTEATWNPIAGCSLVSPGCTNCYAMRRVAPRLSANPATPHYAGTVKPSKGGPVWTGKIGIASDAVLLKPLRWRRPRMIFVNSTSDLFHPDVPDAVIDRVFAVMALCPQHTFQVLTKRPERMREYLARADTPLRIARVILENAVGWAVSGRTLLKPLGNRSTDDDPSFVRLPLPNVWLGTSVEDQQRADERIPHLLATPAAVRFISAEPLLGPVDLNRIHEEHHDGLGHSWESCLKGKRFDPWSDGDTEGHPRLDLVITGGESGRGARLTHPDWVRSLRDQCAEAAVNFFHKQWGEWAPMRDDETIDEAVDQHSRFAFLAADGRRFGDDVAGSTLPVIGPHSPAVTYMQRVGTKRAGRLLDGIEHHAMPGRP